MAQDKTPRQTLEAAVSEQLLTYLGNGSINSAVVAEALSPVEHSIRDYKELKTLHFILSERVAAYVNRLPDRIRSLRTTTTKRTERVHGEVRGEINWKQTLQARSEQGYTDPTVFSIQRPEVEFNTPENCLLKKMISILVEGISLVRDVDQPWWDGWKRTDPEWLNRTLERNIYLDKLPDSAEINLSERDLESARRSRHELYAETYDLYRLYEDFVQDRFERPEVRALFQETLITPASDATLFEVFSLFRYLSQLAAAGDLTLERIRPGMDEVAVLEDEGNKLLKVYYDQTGPLKFFDQYPELEELPAETPEVVRRQVRAFQSYRTAVGEFLDRDVSEGYFGGRPDMLLLEFDDEGELARVEVGEIKYTKSSNTFASGLQQLLEYLHLLRTDGEYLLPEDQQPGEVKLAGVLFTDGAETEREKHDLVRHVTTNDLLEPDEDLEIQ